MSPLWNRNSLRRNPSVLLTSRFEANPLTDSRCARRSMRMCAAIPSPLPSLPYSPSRLSNTYMRISLSRIRTTSSHRRSPSCTCSIHICIEHRTVTAGLASQVGHPRRRTHLGPAPRPRLRHLGRLRPARAAAARGGAEGAAAAAGAAAGGCARRLEGQRRRVAPAPQGAPGHSCGCAMPLGCVTAQRYEHHDDQAGVCDVQM